MLIEYATKINKKKVRQSDVPFFMDLFANSVMQNL